MTQQVLVELIRLEHPHRQVETRIRDQRVRVPLPIGGLVGVDRLRTSADEQLDLPLQDSRANVVEVAEVIEAAGEHAGCVRSGSLAPEPADHLVRADTGRLELIRKIGGKARRPDHCDQRAPVVVESSRHPGPEGHDQPGAGHRCLKLGHGQRLTRRQG